MSKLWLRPNGSDGRPPASCLYWVTTPVSAIVDSTVGLNAAASSSEVFPLKYSVAEVFPPVRILRASSKVICIRASLKMPRAAGAAFSAARFMLSSNSSIFVHMPAMRSPFSTLRSFSARRILMASFLKNPSVVPVRSTAWSVPIWRASLRPEAVLESP